MDVKVPGGRQASADTKSDLVLDTPGGDQVPSYQKPTNHESTSSMCTNSLEERHRFVSQSVPKLQSGDKSTDSDLSEHNSSLTADTKKRHKVGAFLQRLFRPKSSNSIDLNISTSSLSRKFSFRNTLWRKSRRGSPRHGQNNAVQKVPLNNAGGATGGHTDSPPMKTYLNNQVPAMVGLRNHGNTCFMNAIIQCLGHTDSFAEFFVTNKYKLEQKKSKASAKKYGTRGEVTDQLCQLLKCLWTCNYIPEASFDFLSVVGRHAGQYRGNAQHDAQEFFIWLLDKVHEDLNTAVIKKKHKSKGNISSPESASEVIAEHQRCNKSFVYDLFQAWLCSSLMCPSCQRQSNTYDPFLSVSLPIPQKINRAITVHVANQASSSVRVIGVVVDRNGRVADLRRGINRVTSLSENQMVLTEIGTSVFQRTLSDDQPVSDIRTGDQVWCIETPQTNCSEESQTEYLMSRGLVVILLNRTGVGENSQRFSRPFVLQVPRDISYKELKDKVHEMLKKCCNYNPPKQAGVPEFTFRVLDSDSGCWIYLPADVDHPFYVQAVESSLSQSTRKAGPNHLKLIVEWDPQTKNRVFSHTHDLIEDHESLHQSRKVEGLLGVASLDDCFRLYTLEEKLGAEDAWDCPSCHGKQHETTKQLSLWSLPDILVVHLKRFRQDGSERNKLNMMVDFPVVGLDMRSHVMSKPEVNGNSEDYYTYDLYSVCNHYGNMAGGHYTAFCKNSITEKWHLFDDTRVIEVEPNQVVTKEAYLLFYKRRNLKITEGQMIQSQGHWIDQVIEFKYSPKLPKNQYKFAAHDKSPYNQNLEKIQNSNVEVYATLRQPTKSHPSTPDGHLDTGQGGSMAATPMITHSKSMGSLSAGTGLLHPATVNLPPRSPGFHQRVVYSPQRTQRTNPAGGSVASDSAGAVENLSYHSLPYKPPSGKPPSGRQVNHPPVLEKSKFGCTPVAQQLIYHSQNEAAMVMLASRSFDEGPPAMTGTISHPARSSSAQNLNHQPGPPSSPTGKQTLLSQAMTVPAQHSPSYHTDFKTTLVSATGTETSALPPEKIQSKQPVSPSSNSDQSRNVKQPNGVPQQHETEPSEYMSTSPRHSSSTDTQSVSSVTSSYQEKLHNGQTEHAASPVIVRKGQGQIVDLPPELPIRSESLSPASSPDQVKRSPKVTTTNGHQGSDVCDVSKSPRQVSRSPQIPPKKQHVPLSPQPQKTALRAINPVNIPHRTTRPYSSVSNLPNHTYKYTGAVPCVISGNNSRYHVSMVNSVHYNGHFKRGEPGPPPVAPKEHKVHSADSSDWQLQAMHNIVNQTNTKSKPNPLAPPTSQAKPAAQAKHVSTFYQSEMGDAWSQWKASRHRPNVALSTDQPRSSSNSPVSVNHGHSIPQETNV